MHAYIKHGNANIKHFLAATISRPPNPEWCAVYQSCQNLRDRRRYSIRFIDLDVTRL